eukprot:TRINITY_DN3494_c0_g1_i1.p1 TRINITY_DN3494_c0_g1~~TRINITY_DN3494_c0_g1_i1.p1  ORF type:complete len:397 (-),score=13.03 TRINITY_DN3494_c0_g1_i1:135-1325(-)
MSYLRSTRPFALGIGVFTGVLLSYKYDRDRSVRMVPPSWSSLTATTLGYDAHTHTQTRTPITTSTLPPLEGDVIDAPTRMQLACKYGLPSYNNVTFYQSFVSSANYERRIPNWVLQYITKEDLDEDHVVADRKHSQFTGDAPSIPEVFRADNKAYLGSGWSRGHMAPAGDVRHSQLALDETFILGSNIVPQNRHNNSHFWYRLEAFVRHNLNRDGNFDSIRVVSGPCFVPFEEVCEYRDGLQTKKYVKYQVLGNGVAVPTHIFKVILAEYPPAQSHEDPRPCLIAAFLIPNDYIPPQKRLIDYLVPVEYLEARTGLQFFPRLRQHKLATGSLCDAISCSMMTEHDLEVHNYARRLQWANTRSEVESVWREIEGKGRVPDARAQKEYEKKMKQFVHV